MKKVAYVILHYIDLETTINCVESILRHSNDNEKIIVVDNGSPNQSGNRLDEKYKDDWKVFIIKIKKNLGFARGNNIGYQYAREELGADIIIVTNNDTVFYSDIYDELLLVDRMNCEVILPDIINMTGKHQNPYRDRPLSSKQVYWGFLKKIVLAIVYSIPKLNRFMLQRFKNRNKLLKDENPLNPDNYKTMLLPHGACIVFGSRWVKVEKLSFRNCTFMYGEEELLYEYILLKHYRTIYDRNIVVFHMEDQATKKSIASEVGRAGFLHRNSLLSHFHLMRYRTKRLIRRRRV